jgi:Contractile injection system spike tip protein
MPDYAILDGDLVMFMPAFGTATVVVQPGKMIATGQTSLMGKKICLKGDETKVMVPGCMYMTPVYSIPGVGTLKIQALGGNQTSQKTKSGGKEVIVKGSNFTAVFEVQAPAQQPPPGPGPPIPDATPQYTGNGSFITINTKFKVA